MTHAARPWLWPLVPFYRLGLSLREFQLRAGLKPVQRLRRSVVSVGSLSAGGAGKTPLVIALAKALTARGVQVDVLSRGYGRRRRSALPLLVEIHGTAEEFGDEPLEIARATHAPVYVAAERFDAGLLAERSAIAGVHLLDDGFQHRQLWRDVDVLQVSGADLTDHLLPAGNLRETLHAAERASIIAIPAEEPELAEQIRSRGWQAQVWSLRRHVDVPLLDGPAAAFCGIARPEQFFARLRGADVQLRECIAMPDHHFYTAADLARIEDKARKAGATVLLTTMKDFVRLGEFSSTLPLKAVPLQCEIVNETAAIDWLIDHVRGPR